MKHPLKLALRGDDLRSDVKRAISTAGELGFAGLELSAFGHEVSPEALGESGRKHLARLVRNQGLQFVSLAAEAKAGGIADPSSVDREIDRVVGVLRLAADMGVPVVSHDVGSIARLTDNDRDSVLATLRTVATQADRFGTQYAFRFRVLDPRQSAELVDAVGSSRVGAALDPGSMLATGFDPLEAVMALGDRTRLAYLRDAVCGSADHPGYETPLGSGALDIIRYLSEVGAASGVCMPVLRRSRSTHPRNDIAADKSRVDAEMGS